MEARKCITEYYFFQPDGVPPHYFMSVRNDLNESEKGPYLVCAAS